VNLDAVGRQARIDHLSASLADELDEPLGDRAQVMGEVPAAREGDAELIHDLAELMLHVVYLVHPLQVEVVCVAEFLTIAGLCEGPVYVEIGHEIAQLVAEGVVRLSGLHLESLREKERRPPVEEGRGDEDFFQYVGVLHDSRDDRPRESRDDRKFDHHLAD
jgi:hypothetical protein